MQAKMEREDEKFKQDATDLEFMAYITRTGKSLEPLKTRTTPAQEPAKCTHPVAQLSKGSNGRATWVVCKQCNARWSANYQEVLMEAAAQATSARAAASANPAVAASSTAATTVRCRCNLPAVKRLVQKAGPTHGRTFWGYSAHLCNHFSWDEAEVAALSARAKAGSAAATRAHQKAVAEDSEEMMQDT